MERQNSELHDFGGKLLAIHCQNRSVNYVYFVPGCANYAKIILCEGASKTGYWKKPNSKKITYRRLPLSGTKSIQVSTHKNDDTLYAIGLSASSENFQCRKPLNYHVTFFDFSHCQKHSTTPEAIEKTSDLVQRRLSSSKLDVKQLPAESLMCNTTCAFLILFGVLAFIFLGVIIYYIYKKRSSAITSKSRKNSHETVAFMGNLDQQAYAATTFMKMPKSRKNSHETVAFMDNLDQQAYAPTTSMKMPIVYIVFVEDSPQHKNVLIAFANYLQEDLGFSVIFQLWETQKASENYYAWMQNSMESADKIIVVWSDGAAEKLRTFKENKLDFPDTFSPVVQHMQNSLFKYKNVSKYSLVYFSYSDKTSIPNEIFNKTEFRHFELMRDFEELYFNLTNIEKHQPGYIHHFPKTNVKLLFKRKVTKNGPALKKAIKNASKQNSLYLYETESSESINTDTDEIPNLTTINLDLASIASRVDHRINQKSLSLPSLAPKAETFRQRTMSVASIESKLDQHDQEHLHEINYLTQRQEFIHN